MAKGDAAATKVVRQDGDNHLVARDDANAKATHLARQRRDDAVPFVSAARAVSTLLFCVRPEDPLTISVAAALCLATAVLGSLWPALRAARVDPMSALRAE